MKSNFENDYCSCEPGKYGEFRLLTIKSKPLGGEDEEGGKESETCIPLTPDFVSWLNEAAKQIVGFDGVNPSLTSSQQRLLKVIHENLDGEDDFSFLELTVLGDDPRTVESLIDKGIIELSPFSSLSEKTYEVRMTRFGQEVRNALLKSQAGE